MIPIECPKCGRRGSVPPDRLNSRLHCKKCDAVFHLDLTGKLMLGEPGKPEKKQKAARKEESSEPSFDPFEAWGRVPLAAKLGIPLGVLALLGLLYASPFGGGSPEAHVDRGVQIAGALAAGDKGAVTRLATKGTGEDAGKWFDLLRARIEKAGLGAGTHPSASLQNGDPVKSDAITLSAAVADTLTNPKQPRFETFTLHLRREGRNWALDGKQTLADAEQMASALASPGGARGKR